MHQRHDPAVRPHALLLPLFALASLASGAGGCVLAAEAELAEVEVASKGIMIPPAPPEADSDDVTVTVLFRQKPNRAGLAKENFQDVRVLGLALAANSGIGNLGFLRALRVTATSKEAKAAGKPPVEIVRYQRPAKPSTMMMGPQLAIPADPPAEITELWRGSEVEFALEVSGQLPTVAWSADVGMRISAMLVY